MKSGIIRSGGVELKFKLSLRETGQLTVYVFLNVSLFVIMSVSKLKKSYLRMQSKILHYMRQMAVITPYSQFLFKFVSDSSEYALSLSLT